ncbi:MAG: tetratricopeptide repeat protein [Spirochaetaceae bacterium]|jgi:tetratricopeptide (TPR) repeat protein|nr:tetratricopeptide repeat protein [Spirochaetaceae bacterium]
MPSRFYAYRGKRHRKQGFPAVVIILLLFAAGAGVFAIAGGLNNSSANMRRQIMESWREGDYDGAFTMSALGLEKKPMDFFLLTVNGFSAYQIAIAQINSSDTQRFIDASVWSLRKAMLTKEGKRDERIFYVLGKAYYYKGAPFMDLAVSYLEAASSSGYPASDINEYLGLAYAALKDYQSSVNAFSKALQPVNGDAPLSGSDIFLLAIARSYFELGETGRAKAYLMRALEVSRDYKTIVSARILLGNVFVAENDLAAAENQYLTILNESGESAEARFFLGEIYALKENTIRARAEWRKALRIDPAYAPARERLNI